MPDVLDRLDQLVPTEAEVRLDPAWTTIHRRTVRSRRRRGLTAVAATAAVLAGGAFVGEALTADGTTQVATAPDSSAAFTLHDGWNTLPELPIGPRINPAITEMEDGGLFVWGGYTPGSVGLQIFDGATFDPETGEWEVLPAAPEVIPNEAVAVWTGDDVVVMPSSGTTPFLPLVWSAADDAWRVAAAGPADCTNAGATWTGEEVVVVCGIASPNDSGISLAAYDPATDTWRTLPQPPASFTDADLAWTGERLVAFGRTEQLSVPAGDGTAATYDPATDAWDEPFQVPVNAQETAITWTGSEVVVVNYDMSAATFDPVSGESRSLDDVPLRFYECSPELNTAGSTAVVDLCSGSAALGEDDTWTPFVAPPSFLAGSVGGTAATFGTDDEGRIVAYRPPAPDAEGQIPFGSTVPLGVSTFTPPDGAAVTQASLDEQSTVTRNELTVEIDGETCLVASTYAPFARSTPEGSTAVDVTVADGTTRPGTWLDPDGDQLTYLRWIWGNQLTTDEQEVACPTEALALELARGFTPPSFG
jgi:hypothetical protein